MPHEKDVAGVSPILRFVEEEKTRISEERLYTGFDTA
jgi:hypothetical protein